jgi:hypothetical protein
MPFDEKFSCPRRFMPGEDQWRDHAHNTQGGKHSCGYCGSVHPDEFMQAVRDGVEVIPTDKNYKAYLQGPQFSHAKFYYQHLSEAQKDEFLRLLNAKAVKVGVPGFFYTLPYFLAPA